MIIIFTFKDEDGNECLDYGVDTETDKLVTLPPERLNCMRQGIHWDPKEQYHYIP